MPVHARFVASKLAGQPAASWVPHVALGRVRNHVGVEAPGRYAHFSRTVEHAIFEPPGLGEHSRDVLTDAGLSQAQIDDLIEAGVVKQGGAFQLVAIQNYR